MRRINLVISEKLLERLERLQEKFDSPTLTETIRRTIQTMDAIEEERDGDGKIVVKKADGEESCIIVPCSSQTPKADGKTRKGQSAKKR